MRAGGCAMQQALTSEAAGTVKQAVALAKRRGHAQVTPLHVANTMLAATTGLLRTACLQSHSHPLRCNALELCFNVALNRLPASPSSPILGHHHLQFPSISKALVAAFKRAQAHQRRGSIENQQQSILSVKVELAHLIISILDDPSVSRVMREAGFSSTQVKRNVEKAVSSSNKSKENSLLSLSPSPSQSPPFSDQTKRNNSKPTTYESVKNEDINSVINGLMNKGRKSIVIVGECVSDIETVVKGVMNRVRKGEIPENLRELELRSIPPYSFCNLHREEVENKMTELTCLLKSPVAKGVVLYLGDLKWILDNRVSSGIYCPLEHMIMELGRLVHGIGVVRKFWLMGIATFQTYRRCTTGHNSLETVWGVQPVTIPADCLGLSLISHSNEQIEERSNINENGNCQLLLTTGEENLTCRADYLAKFLIQTPNSRTSICNRGPTISSLPPWLRNGSRRLNIDDQNCVSMGENCRKWNSISDTVQSQPLPFGTISSASPQNHNLQLSHFPLLASTQPQENQQSLSAAPNSAASSSAIMDMDQYVQKFKEFTAENLNILCTGLEKRFPRQKEIIPEIASAVLQCRSGMLRRKDKKQETWLYFQGLDARAKQEIARELAKIIFDTEHADYCSKTGIKMAIERGRMSNANGEEVSLYDAIIILSSESISSRTRFFSTKQKSDESMQKKGCVSLDLNISFDDHDNTVCVEDQSIDRDVWLLENVDRCIVFNNQPL
ncbi:protein SMAX1-LIKE 3-like isoform X2 [Olea europaea var. sylvestris]|uniref:protein SMAX1-LIKE 3-like isoform X2 n=1 Tax=Olea europaea var. sylvestris TaxID=158386 RepID=UPI000C1CED04|nr:protein SMAX1-LIKE 3-like isoform X2 [Olea europaea var. sylvestris]